MSPAELGMPVVEGKAFHARFQSSFNEEEYMIIGLDVGGTHTDVVLLSATGLVRKVKVSTDTSDLFSTVLTGLTKITDHIDVGLIKRAVLSTTLTTNAIVQKQLPEVGIIVSSGPGISPDAFRVGEHYYAVGGSIDHRGREVAAIDPSEIRKIAKKLKANGIGLVGVAGKFSTRNPAHELAIEKILGGGFDKVFLGHRISGNLSFPRRIATTHLNAAVYGTHKKFFEAVKGSLAEKGLSIPIHILKADGGTMNFESSMDFPGQTILSGPAASAMGSIAHAPAGKDVISLDIGGTTTDIAILVDGSPLLEPVGIKRAGYRTLIRSLKSWSVGLGGDSAIALSGKTITIGPERRGPAMAFGGPCPTPTDALFILDHMTDGDRKLSEAGLSPIAEALGLPLEAAARKIFDQFCRMILAEAEKMVENINSKPVYTVHELLEGYRVKPSLLLVMGGPAEFFAEHLGSISDLPAAAVPDSKVANAMGAALARTTCEVTLFADTERGRLTAPEEDYTESIPDFFSKRKTIQKACELLEQKAMRIGANPDDFEAEVVEELEFNMVRGFTTTGKNIRVKVQAKPGLIRGYDTGAAT